MKNNKIMIGKQGRFWDSDPRKTREGVLVGTRKGNYYKYVMEGGEGFHNFEEDEPKSDVGKLGWFWDIEDQLAEECLVFGRLFDTIEGSEYPFRCFNSDFRYFSTENPLKDNKTKNK